MVFKIQWFSLEITARPKFKISRTFFATLLYFIEGAYNLWNFTNFYNSARLVPSPFINRILKGSRKNSKVHGYWQNFSDFWQIFNPSISKNTGYESYKYKNTKVSHNHKNSQKITTNYKTFCEFLWLRETFVILYM